jgi:osmotically-inducible protein OsmY
MPLEEKQLGLRIQREVTKRATLDSTDLRVHVAGGVVYLNGRVRAFRTAVGVDLRHEMDVLERSIRSVPGVRDIVNEVEVKG